MILDFRFWISDLGMLACYHAIGVEATVWTVPTCRA